MTTETTLQKVHPSVQAESLLVSMLVPGERIVHIATISKGIYWHGLAVGAAGLLTFYFGGWLAAYLLAISCLMLFLAYSTQRYLVLATTDHRVIVRAGIVNQQVMQLRYHQVESVDVLSTLPGMLLGYGSVIITGTGRLRMIVPFVQDAVAFRDHLTQKLLEREMPLPSEDDRRVKRAV
jgi:hypothetical protein